MTTDEQLDQTISRWLEAEAPSRIPDHVLRTTFERTRRSRQPRQWRPRLRRVHLNPRLAVAAGVGVVVIATMSAGLYVSRPSVGGLLPSPTTQRSPIPTAT